ncbi:MAG: hypothetical protein IT503_05260 [Burkholderiaceae bacterium]|nr:hypothetical protein [Ideonella sp.]MCC7285571.1 hypothetical protein [Burkholderiaceae bacterium]
MSQPESPAPRQPEGHAALTREQKIQLLHEELVKLNAQLEYLRLMLRLRKPCDG